MIDPVLFATPVALDRVQHRAQRLAALGAVLCLDAPPLDGKALADGIEHLLHFAPQPAALALGGAARTAELLAQLAARRTQKEPSCATC